MLFAEPRREVRSIIQCGFSECVSASIVVGFATEAGIRTIEDAIQCDPGKLRQLVIGAGNYNTFKACDRLIEAGTNRGALRVHLGIARSAAQASAYRNIRPMLHSKVYLFEMRDGTARALVGSHNLTEFAMTGMNGEAAILLEGLSSTPEFDDIRRHIDTAWDEALDYDPAMKEGYDQLAKKGLRGWLALFGDWNQNGPTQKKTYLVFGALAGNDLPQEGDILYFEIPEAIVRVASTNTEVHVYLFGKLPRTPQEALNQIDSATRGFICEITGIEDDQGGVELQVDWTTGSRTRPQLQRTSRPFRPNPTSDMQQVRVKVLNKKLKKFEYLFEKNSSEWVPILESNPLQLSEIEDPRRKAIKGWALEDKQQWFRIKGLERVEKQQRKKLETLETALQEMSPDSGNFILLSHFRRKKDG